MKPTRRDLAALLMFANLFACSGGSGSAPSSDAGGPPPPNDSWAGRTNVEAVFEASCSGCHGTAWSSCWTVQANAQEVASAVSSGAMPRGNPLSSPDKATVIAWFGQGAPCSGTKPDDAGTVFIGGEGAPTASH